MPRLPLAAALCALFAAPACASAPVQDAGPAYLVLRGDYVGKTIRITADDRVLDDRHFTFPPPGAEDRYALPDGPARTVRLNVRIDGCPSVWNRPTPVAPGLSVSLIFRGCEIEALPPE